MVPVHAKVRLHSDLKLRSNLRLHFDVKALNLDAKIGPKCSGGCCGGSA